MRYYDPQDVPALGGAQTSTQNPQTQATPGTPNTPFSIPNSDVYLGATNQANKAYEDAKAQLLANRNSLYHQYGLTDTGATDINNPYGQYQMLLGAEGQQLDSARNNSLSRGLGSGGLAEQGEQALIPGIRLEQLGFQHSVDQAGADYASGLTGAENQRTSAIDQGYQNALLDALSRGLFDPAPAATTTTTAPPPPGGNNNTDNNPPPGVFTSTTAARVAAATKNQKPNAPVAVKVAANKTGASANKKQGIFSIH